MTDEDAVQVVKEETARWLASIWRSPDPTIWFSAFDGTDPFIHAPSTESVQIASLKSATNVRIRAHGSEMVDTGVSITVPPKACAIVVPDDELNRSACMVAQAAFGEGDTGRIALRLYNLGDYDYEVKDGQPIAGVVMVPAMMQNYLLSEV